jgi:hypothetical protein
MTLYFAQPTNGGPIKVGHTGRDVSKRMVVLGAWIPGGVEVIATIPGGPEREEALKWVLRPYRLQGEWVRSCADVWRVIIEAVETGDLAWLPSEFLSGQDMGAALKGEFGSRSAGAVALGYSAGSLGTLLAPSAASAGLQGRFAIEQARRAGRLPAFLTGAGA